MDQKTKKFNFCFQKILNFELFFLRRNFFLNFLEHNTTNMSLKRKFNVFAKNTLRASIGRHFVHTLISTKIFWMGNLRFRWNSKYFWYHQSDQYLSEFNGNNSIWKPCVLATKWYHFYKNPINITWFHDLKTIWYHPGWNFYQKII